MSEINIQNLSRDYGSGKGIFDISFQVDKGEVFGFLGPNGAGKTTTIRHLMGFIKPKSGICQITGLDCWKDRDIIQEKLGYIPGEINFFDNMTGKEFLKFVSDYRNIGKDNRMQEMLERFELDPQVKIREMSKGMKQKLSIVVAFMLAVVYWQYLFYCIQYFFRHQIQYCFWSGNSGIHVCASNACKCRRKNTICKVFYFLYSF